MRVGLRGRGRVRAGLSGGTVSRSILGLTLHRPWSWCLAHPEKFEVAKVCENRDYSAYGYARKHGLNLRRGDLIAIHAGLKWDDEGAAWIQSVFDTSLPSKASQPTGIVGLATLVAVTRQTLEVYDAEGKAVRDPWAREDRWHWYLDAAIPFYEPVPCAGAPGLWHLDHTTTIITMDLVRRVETDRAKAAVVFDRAKRRLPWSRVRLPESLTTAREVSA